MTHRGTLPLESASRERWDALVLGAGPAGALAARELAGTGARVLLVDRKAFPRWKVCGACLNRRALSVLDAVGLGDLTNDLHAIPLREFALTAFDTTLKLSLPEGRAVSRTRFDAALVDAATQAGAEFLPETQATLGPICEDSRRVLLHQHGRTTEATARVVLVACGLGSSSLGNDPNFRVGEARHSRIGAGCVIAESSSDYSDGTIFMAVGRGGYVGLVRVEDGSLNVAAAFDRSVLRRRGSPALAAVDVLRQAGLPVPSQLVDVEWHGTVTLTRRVTPLAAERVFLIGDAAGYVEPFTGEGIAWALESGRAIAPLAQQAIHHWQPGLVREWTVLHRRLIGRRQRVCRGLRWLLRRPLLVRGAMAVLSRMPSLAEPLVQHLTTLPAVPPTKASTPCTP